MGLFRKKPDPLKDREKNLSSEIEQLEEQIRQLQGVLSKAASEPRVRQTAYPARSSRNPDTGGDNRPANAPGEPVFEPVDQHKLQQAAPNPFKDRTERQDGQALKREGSTTLVERFNRFFRGPTSSNPKLVSYLAAGNIHGLQPLRYERRVARNKLLLWIVIFIILIVGFLKVLLP
ncbi:MAG TPA: hypothetical protein DCY13_14815 [Verrucomicrobiales bacterium]|nr:hypothetical protein [Verrucomicrobiales bacterium]